MNLRWKGQQRSLCGGLGLADQQDPPLRFEILTLPQHNTVRRTVINNFDEEFQIA
jgi:hypothetical protein